MYTCPFLFRLSKCFTIVKHSLSVESFENEFEKFKIVIDYKNKKGLLLNPKTWCKIKFKTNNCILMVFCDREYEFKDYIENYKNFLKIAKKK